MTEFLLTREPWVPVVTPEGTDTLGLIDLFEHAETAMLAPNGPLEERAVHRLLLSISYAALGAPSEREYPRRFNGGQVADWLRDNEEAFDLISPTAPFIQDTTLAEEEAHSQIVAMANIDSTVARTRPLLTDHRGTADIPQMPLAEAAIALLVYNSFDAPGLHEGVSSTKGGRFALKGTEGTFLAYTVKGTLATSMAWSMLPTDTLGEPTWTYTGPGDAETTPAGELEALTWLYRRLLLRHNGTHATSIQIHQGRARRDPVTDAPADTLPGQRHYVLSDKDPKSVARAGQIGPPTTAGRGNPLALIERWEAGSDTSLSGRVRAALAQNPDLTPPRVAIIGQRLEKTALKVLVRESEVPQVAGGHSERAQAIQEARSARGLFPSDDHRALSLLHADTLDDAVAGLDALAIPTLADDIEWPTHAQSLSSGRTIPATPAPEIEGVSDDVLRDLALVMEIEEKKEVGHPQRTTLRRLRAALYREPEITAALAQTTASRIPSEADVAPLGFTDLNASQRLWVGLLAVSINDWRNHRDGEKPLPQALRQAGARLDFTQARDALIAATEASTLNALRPHLITAITMMARSHTSFSWWSLADDLESWTPPIRRAWTKAFSTKTSTTEQGEN